MGGDRFDSAEDRLHDGDAGRLGSPGGSSVGGSRGQFRSALCSMLLSRRSTIAAPCGEITLCITAIVGLIPVCLSDDRFGPGALGEGSDGLWCLHECVPGIAASSEDVVAAVPDLMAQEVGPQELPDVFDRVEFGDVGWQRQKADVIGHRQSFSRLMPAGAVEDEHGVSAGCDLRTDFPQMLGHRFAVDRRRSSKGSACEARGKLRRYDDCGADAALRTNGAEEIGGVVAIVAYGRRPRATLALRRQFHRLRRWNLRRLRPDIGQRALLANLGFVSEPDLEWLAGNRGWDHRRYQAGETFLKGSCAAATAIILVHNHPSGCSKPFRDDIAMTKNVQAALAPLDITLHDHVTIGKGNFFSFRQSRLLESSAQQEETAPTKSLRFR